jgi:hypothetical protein
MLSMDEAVGILRSVFPDHRASLRYQVMVKNVFSHHAIWLGAPVQVVELADRDRFDDQAILGIMCKGPLGKAQHVLVFNAIGTEERPPEAPKVRGVFVVEGESLDGFLKRYHREVWRTLFEGNSPMLFAPDVEAAAILHDGWVVMRLGRPDFLLAVERRRPGIETRKIPLGGPPDGHLWVIQVDDACVLYGKDEPEVVRHALDLGTWGASSDRVVKIAYLDQQSGMSDDAVRSLERAGILTADRRVMDVLLDLLFPVQDRVSRWDVESWARLNEPEAITRAHVDV